MTPSMAVVAGAVYRVLGIHTVAAEAVLATIAIGIVLGGFALLYALFGLFDVARPWRLGGLAVLTLAPTYWTAEAIDFRTLEGGLAVLLLVALLYKQSALNGRTPSMADWIVVAALNAVLFAVSPTVAAGGLAASALLLATQVEPRRWIMFGGLFALIMVAVQLPWIARNQSVFGRPIVSRDNDGLEMSIAYHPGAANVPMSLDRYWTRINEIHPYDSPAAYARMQRMGGELAYYDMLRRQVRGWIVSHPRQAAFLTLRHVKEFMIPDRWQFQMKNSRGLETIRFFTVLFGCCIGYVSALGSFLWLPRGRYAAVATLVIPLAYSIVDPVPRYMWVTYGLLTCWSAAVLWAVANQVRRQRAMVARRLPST